MTLRRFLDCAYTLLVEEYQRIGLDLMTALEKVAEWRAGARETDVLVPADARQNDQAMNLLMAKMAGVRGAPK